MKSYYDEPIQSQDDVIDSLLLRYKIIDKINLYENKQLAQEDDYTFSDMHSRIDRLLEEKGYMKQSYDINDLVDDILYSKEKNKLYREK